MGFCRRLHLNRFHLTKHTHLVLQAAVLSLRVLPDDDDVDVAVSTFDTRQGLAVHDVGVQVQGGAAKRRGGKCETADIRRLSGAQWWRLHSR